MRCWLRNLVKVIAVALCVLIVPVKFWGDALQNKVLIDHVSKTSLPLTFENIPIKNGSINQSPTIACQYPFGSECQCLSGLLIPSERFGLVKDRIILVETRTACRMISYLTMNPFIIYPSWGFTTVCADHNDANIGSGSPARHRFGNGLVGTVFHIHHDPSTFFSLHVYDLTPNQPPCGKSNNPYYWARDQIRSIKPVTRLFFGAVFLIAAGALLSIGIFGDGWIRLGLSLLGAYFLMLLCCAFWGSVMVYG